MKFTIWHSSIGLGEFIVNNTSLQNYNYEFRVLPESDASRPNIFHKVPTHIKNILYLDCPDIIIELNSNPILSLEISTEAGTGHNVFQRYARLAAAMEYDIPSIYIYPEAVKVYRANVSERWDPLNPLIFHALKKTSSLFEQVPALFYYYPSYYRSSDTVQNNEVNQINKGLKQNDDVPEIDSEMRAMFEAINMIIQKAISPTQTKLINERVIAARINYMEEEYMRKYDGRDIQSFSPLSATIKVPSSAVINYMRNNSGPDGTRYDFSNTIWTEREYTILYKVNANFRGDPYPGALSAIDYMLCRNGKTYEDRDYNLAMVWGDCTYYEDNNTLVINNPKSEQSINNFVEKVRSNNSNRSILHSEYRDLDFNKIPRYYMQVRFGSMFSKPKEIRVYSYFCDAILFNDGTLWRES